MGRIIDEGYGGIDQRPFLTSEVSARDGQQTAAIPEQINGSAGSTNAINKGEEAGELPLGRRVWRESKKLWYILGPSIFSRLANFSMFVSTQAFAGHLGEVELAAMAITITVIIGFNFGFMLGMASALETLCGQAFGAKRYHMLGIYVQRSFIVLFVCCFLFLPLYIFAAPLLRLLGQSDAVAELTGELALWVIPTHFSFAFIFPLVRFFQSQLKTPVIAFAFLLGLTANVAASWLCTYVLGFGVFGLALCLALGWWLVVFGMLGYAMCGGCPLTWKGWSVEAFSGLWEFIKLSVASGVMLCMNISDWELMIPIAFFAATGVRVANELGAGNGKAAKFAAIVSVVQSTIIGIFFCMLVMVLRSRIAFIFTSSADVIEEVSKLSYLLGATILLNSVQPILSGVAVGSGWQAYVAYINLGCYYGIGLPLGFLMGWVFNLSIMGIWGGMIFGGTAVQTVILSIIVVRCDWEREAEKAQQRVAKWSTTNNPN
ncbi:hypothetical protein CDL15_Pgr007003 [Punica granatum]|uniref:Protein DETOXIFICATION n=1 Tax=Punica granatum TaxID=22663 RepID=A0A218X9A4_PUNGR|nr:hypothetical protein CDL15_Pgr007003 [Punica granatum]PKI45593.1 hypothetical protein CRG98_033909 [Punica granatum]